MTEDLFASHQGVALGAPAPAFTLPDLDGHLISLADLLKGGQPLLLVFTDPSCGRCGELMPELAAWEQEHGDVVTIRVISRRDAALNRAMAERHGLAGVLVQRDREVAPLYGASATPSAGRCDSPWWRRSVLGLRARPARAGHCATERVCKNIKGTMTCVRPFGGDTNASQDCKCKPDAKEGDGCIEARPHCGSSDKPC